MAQHDLYGSASSTRTMIGLGLGQQLGESRSTGPERGTEAPPGCFIKRFNWGGDLTGGVVREFTRQALGVATLRHPHVVQVVDAGSARDGTPFVVMERLTGATLAERAGGTSIPLPELIPILRGVASGLAAAHTAGVAHLELRADNVFMADVVGYAYGFPKLLDFGVAVLTEAACARGHEVAALAVDAVPPEQRLSLARGDARSDQYALAALAYTFLSTADLTTPIERALTRAMSWHPDRRFDSMGAFLEALEAAVRQHPQAQPSRAAAAETPALPALEAGSLTQQFFADGERLEQAAEEQAVRAGSSRNGATDDAGDVTLSVPERVPRSRAPMIAALSLALASLVIIGWTAVSLSDAPRWPEHATAEAFQQPLPVAPAAAPGTTRTASTALRALQPARAATRPGRLPTEPPPVTAPSAFAAAAPPAAAPAAALPPAAVTAPTEAAPPPSPTAEPIAAAAPTAPPIPEGVVPSSDQNESEQPIIEDNRTAEPPAP